MNFVFLFFPSRTVLVSGETELLAVFYLLGARSPGVSSPQQVLFCLLVTLFLRFLRVRSEELTLRDSRNEPASALEELFFFSDGPFDCDGLDMRYNLNRHASTRMIERKNLAGRVFCK